VFECAVEDSIMRRASPIKGCCATKKESRYSHESTVVTVLLVSPGFTSSKSVFAHGVLTKCFM